MGRNHICLGQLENHSITGPICRSYNHLGSSPGEKRKSRNLTSSHNLTAFHGIRSILHFLFGVIINRIHLLLATMVSSDQERIPNWFRSRFYSYGHCCRYLFDSWRVYCEYSFSSKDGPQTNMFVIRHPPLDTTYLLCSSVRYFYQSGQDYFVCSKQIRQMPCGKYYSH